MRFNLRTLLLVAWLAPPVVIGVIEYVDSSTDLQYYAAYATSGTWLEEAVGEALVDRDHYRFRTVDTRRCHV